MTVILQSDDQSGVCRHVTSSSLVSPPGAGDLHPDILTAHSGLVLAIENTSHDQYSGIYHSLESSPSFKSRDIFSTHLSYLWKVPSGEVSEVASQLKETLVTSSNTNTKTSQAQSNKTKNSFTLEKDVGTSMYDGMYC